MIGVWLQGGATLGRSQGGGAFLPWSEIVRWLLRLSRNVQKCGGGVEGSRHLSLKHGGVLFTPGSHHSCSASFVFSFFQDIVIRYRAPDEMTNGVMKACAK